MELPGASHVSRVSAGDEGAIRNCQQAMMMPYLGSLCGIYPGDAGVESVGNHVANFPASCRLNT